MEIFSAAGSIRSHVGHYKKMLTNKGYVLNSESAPDQLHQLLQFSGDKGLVDIMISKQSVDGKVMDTIQIRPN